MRCDRNHYRFKMLRKLDSSTPSRWKFSKRERVTVAHHFVEQGIRKPWLRKLAAANARRLPERDQIDASREEQQLRQE